MQLNMPYQLVRSINITCTLQLLDMYCTVSFGLFSFVLSLYTCQLLIKQCNQLVTKMKLHLIFRMVHLLQNVLLNKTFFCNVVPSKQLSPWLMHRTPVRKFPGFDSLLNQWLVKKNQYLLVLASMQTTDQLCQHLVGMDKTSADCDGQLPRQR